VRLRLEFDTKLNIFTASKGIFITILMDLVYSADSLDNNYHTTTNNSSGEALKNNEQNRHSLENGS